MMRRAQLIYLLLLLPATNALSQKQEPIPVIEGYVTRTVSLADFDVNGLHIVASKSAVFLADAPNKETHTTRVDPYLGQSVTVYGEVRKKKHEVIVDNVIFHAVDKTALSGIAIVDRVLSPSTPGSGPIRLLVRADGYFILLNATTKITFEAPLASVSDVATNMWIRYHSKPQSDGIVLADTATFLPNTIPKSEAKLLDKNDYDPSAVDPDSKQNIASKFIRGRDPKMIPPYKDAALQARVDRIGASLIPTYQRKLPESDLTKVLFHFQPIDDPRMNDALALPSGVILIPFQIVNYLQNDSQLATVLADNIATILEKQTYRAKSGRTKRSIAEGASAAGGIIVSGPTLIASSLVAASDKRNAIDQSGRVSLGLLHDAGYDIDQAPIAWWLLAADTADKLPSTPLPERAANLYKSLGSTWHNYSEDSTQTSATLQTK
jgi:hypothetical protein